MGEAAAYKHKVGEEFRQLNAELHGQQQALVKARREVRRLVGKRSEERMIYEKLLDKHHQLQKSMGLPLDQCEKRKAIDAAQKAQLAAQKSKKGKKNRRKSKNFNKAQAQKPAIKPIQ